jgi:hypothetical protein
MQEETHVQKVEENNYCTPPHQRSFGCSTSELEWEIEQETPIVQILSIIFLFLTFS